MMLPFLRRNPNSQDERIARLERTQAEHRELIARLFWLDAVAHRPRLGRRTCRRKGAR